MALDARVREGLTMIDKQLPEVDPAQGFDELTGIIRRGDRRRRRTVLTSAAAAAVVAAAGVVGLAQRTDDTVQPAPSVDTTNWIMFSTTEGIGYVSADGSQEGPLVRVDAADGGGWSPDGNHIAYTATGTDGAGDVWIADLDGQHSQQELDCQTCSARYVDWSPDGTRLVYTFQESEAGPYELRVRTLTTGEELVVSFPPGQEIRAPHWSPDSTTVALVVDLGITDRVATVDPAAGLSSLRYVSPASAGAQRPTWSPDGSQIVFSAGTPGPVVETEASNDLYVVRADGTGLRQVTHSNPGVRVFGAEWETDGLRFLASLAEGTQPAHLVRVSADGTEIVPVTGPDGAQVLGIHATLRY